MHRPGSRTRPAASSAAYSPPVRSRAPNSTSMLRSSRCSSAWSNAGRGGSGSRTVRAPTARPWGASRPARRPGSAGSPRRASRGGCWRGRRRRRLRGHLRRRSRRAGPRSGRPRPGRPTRASAASATTSARSARTPAQAAARRRSSSASRPPLPPPTSTTVRTPARSQASSSMVRRLHAAPAGPSAALNDRRLLRVAGSESPTGARRSRASNVPSPRRTACGEPVQATRCGVAPRSASAPGCGRRTGGRGAATAPRAVRRYGAAPASARRRGRARRRPERRVVRVVVCRQLVHRGGSAARQRAPSPVARSATPTPRAGQARLTSSLWIGRPRQGHLRRTIQRTRPRPTCDGPAARVAVRPLSAAVLGRPSASSLVVGPRSSPSSAWLADGAVGPQVLQLDHVAARRP